MYVFESPSWSLRLPLPNGFNSMPTRPPRRAHRTHGITLVEMLISLALTLLMMLAMVQVFDLMGRGLRKGRASIVMAGQLRSVAHRLQQDLIFLIRDLRWPLGTR